MAWRARGRLPLRRRLRPVLRSRGWLRQAAGGSGMNFPEHGRSRQRAWLTSCPSLQGGSCDCPVTREDARPLMPFAKEPRFHGGGPGGGLSRPTLLLLIGGVLLVLGDAGCGCGDQLNGRAPGGGAECL